MYFIQVKRGNQWIIWVNSKTGITEYPDHKTARKAITKYCKASKWRIIDSYSLKIYNASEWSCIPPNQIY